MFIITNHDEIKEWWKQPGNLYHNEIVSISVYLSTQSTVPIETIAIEDWKQQKRWIQ